MVILALSMFSALQSAAGWIQDTVMHGGWVAALIVCVLIVVWLVIVAMLLLGYARGVQMKRSSLALLTAIALVIMLAIAEYSMFTFGADLGNTMSHQRI